jgi:hypothetical protein
MALPARRRATHDDVLAVPAHQVAEIIRGELRVSPRPAAPHAGVASALVWALSGSFRYGIGGPGGWIVLAEPELHLEEPGAPIVPDVAAWRRERLPELPEAAALELAPDWVCEVLSPRTAALDRADKMPIYAEAKVGHAWLVDPAVRTLEVYRLEGRSWRLVGTWHGDVRVRLEPFEAVELDLTLIWAR